MSVFAILGSDLPDHFTFKSGIERIYRPMFTYRIEWNLAVEDEDLASALTFADASFLEICE